MKIFPLANMSKLSQMPGEALRESLTHPFPFIVSGKTVENTSVSSNKNGIAERYGFSSGIIFRLTTVYST